MLTDTEWIMLIGIGVVFVSVLVSRRVTWFVQKKADTMLSEAHSPHADFEGKCLVCTKFSTSPGIVQIVDGRFLVKSVLGVDWDFSLDEISLKKEGRKWNSPGCFMWLFTLTHPVQGKFGIAVDSPDEWREHLVHKRAPIAESTQL